MKDSENLLEFLFLRNNNRLIDKHFSVDLDTMMQQPVYLSGSCDVWTIHLYVFVRPNSKKNLRNYNILVFQMMS